MSLSARDEDIFKRTLETGNLDIFTESFFALPWSGTWFTPEDRPEQYEMLYDAWVKLGKPDHEFAPIIDGKSATLKIMWDSHYGDYPMILVPHGFRMLPWLRQMVSPEIGLGLAITGAGSGKTAGVCMAALSYAALYPGFRFLNVAPTSYQASLMLTEIEKWCVPSSPFRRFIVPSRGAHDLWIESSNRPTLTIEVWPGYPSTFVCQTVGRDANNILGTEQDWINCDEAVLLSNIEVAEPKLGTRLRGTRGTGIPRWGKLTWITNPGPNPDFVSLLEKYEKLAETEEDVIVMQDVDSSVNVYITKHQLDKQQRIMSQQAVDRWHGGSLAAAMIGSGFDQRLLDACRTERMDEAIEGISLIDDLVGLREYELEYEPDHHYVVAGDAGKCSVQSLSSQNIPTVMVFDVTDFLDKPHSIRLVAFYWLDGHGSYKVFLKKMKHAMLKYRAKGYYDATNVQSAFEDVGKGGFDGWPTEMIFFSGHVGVKAWAITIATKLMEDRQFEWPHIRGLWHQARIFEATSKSRADDIIATILVFCLALRHEAMFWDRLAERYDWEEVGEEDERLFEEDEIYTQSYDRHARLLA